MIESHLLVAKPSASILNQIKLQCCILVGRGKLLLIWKLHFLVLLLAKLLLCLLLSRLLAQRLKFLLARSKSFCQSERSDPTEIPHIEHSWYVATARWSYRILDHGLKCTNDSAKLFRKWFCKSTPKSKWSKWEEVSHSYTFSFSQLVSLIATRFRCIRMQEISAASLSYLGCWFTARFCSTFV